MAFRIGFWGREIANLAVLALREINDNQELKGNYSLKQDYDLNFRVVRFQSVLFDFEISKKKTDSKRYLILVV